MKIVVEPPWFLARAWLAGGSFEKWSHAEFEIAVVMRVNKLKEEAVVTRANHVIVQKCAKFPLKKSQGGRKWPIRPLRHDTNEATCREERLKANPLAKREWDNREDTRTIGTVKQHQFQRGNESRETKVMYIKVGFLLVVGKGIDEGIEGRPRGVNVLNHGVTLCPMSHCYLVS